MFDVISVSIPFKREGLSEPRDNSEPRRTWIIRFNSLQTGRTFRTMQRSIGNVDAVKVSIPFKREGLSEQML